MLSGRTPVACPDALLAPPTCVARDRPDAVARCLTDRPLGAVVGGGVCSRPAHQAAPAPTAPATIVAKAVATTHRSASPRGSHPHDTHRATHKLKANVTVTAPTANAHRTDRKPAPLSPAPGTGFKTPTLWAVRHLKA